MGTWLYNNGHAVQVVEAQHTRKRSSMSSTKRWDPPSRTMLHTVSAAACNAGRDHHLRTEESREERAEESGKRRAEEEGIRAGRAGGAAEGEQQRAAAEKSRR